MGYKSKVNKKLSKKLLSYAPDIYTRYYLGIKVIEALRGKRKTRILDIGGRAGIFGKFIKLYDLPYTLDIIDIRKDPKNNPTLCDKYIQGDFLAKDLKTIYDFTTSFDVLEHIKNKEKFIDKLLDVSNSSIITAPFDSSLVRESEIIVNELFKKYTGKYHPWLKEHTQFKLPDKKWLENYLGINDIKYLKIGSNNLCNWVTTILPNLIPAYFQVNTKHIENLNYFYNKNFIKLGDCRKPCYRYTYIISKKKIYNKKLEKLLKKSDVKPDSSTRLKFNELTIDSLTEILKNKDKEGIELNKKYIEQNNENNIKTQEIKILVNTNQFLQNKIDSILNSKSWKIARLISKMYKIPASAMKYIFNFIKNALNEGPKETFMRIVRKIENKEEDKIDINEQYKTWLNKNKLTPEKVRKQIEDVNNFKYKPKISIIMPVYNVEEKYLREAIDSVLFQTYPNWELCIADDASTKAHIQRVLNEYKEKDKRIKVVFRKENGHISRSSNSALELATGEFIGLLDNDDIIHPQSLYKVVNSLNKNKEWDLIYSDEDKLELDGRRTHPFFKPDWSPDMFLSANYICHFTVIRKSLVDKVKGFRVGYEGSQDYDLFLRVTEKTRKIHHIPDILYSWRKIPGSTAVNYDKKSYAHESSIKALKSVIKRRKLNAKVEKGVMPGMFRIKYKIQNNPLVSIIIPTKDKVNYLKRCLKSIFKKSTYKNLEILIVDTGSNEAKTERYYKRLKKFEKIRFLKWNNKFNYSAANNFGAEKAKGKYLLFLNNDTEVINSDWIESMLEHAQRKEIGAVGAKLLYPNNRIQHAGIILGFGGVAGHAMKYFKDIKLGLPYPKDIIRNYTAVTAACLMISKKKFFEVKGLDEKFRIAFNDVDFCLKLYNKGYLNLYTPYAKLYHYESISVGRPNEGTRDMLEFHKETKRMKDKWGYLIKKDPYYNSNFTLEKENFTLDL